MPKVLVTPHACRAYAERVCAVVTEQQAEAEIGEALRAPLFRCPSADGKLTLWGCLNRAGFPFLAGTDPADEGAEFLLVRTVGPKWFWHECKELWGRHSVGPRRQRRVIAP